ncbi:MAG: cobalt ECF transporter T component CbiQ [Sedimentisphaerales bacterium]|nr:cobalt ECF transporter T component CbiQ [Sedimentisphaerales bacterium]
MHHAHIDKFAYQDSPVHRLDARVKFIVMVIFMAFVISLPPNSVVILSLYAIGPFAVLVSGRIPLRFVFKQIIIVSPFILVLALSCPFYDRTPVSVSFGPLSWQITAGWLRCCNILAKFTVTMMCIIALVSTTRFTNLLEGLGKLGIPKILTAQLGLLYRYIFVVIDKAQHMLLSRRARSSNYLGFRNELKTASAMIGSLFIRSIDTAENISIAMQGRGFNQKWRSLSQMHTGWADYLFIVLSAIYILALELFAKPVLT